MARQVVVAPQRDGGQAQFIVHHEPANDSGSLEPTMRWLQWLLTERVRHAQELLETTALSIEEIAGHCGFGTAINLRQHFTRRVQLSPQAYRRAFQLH